MMARKRQIAMIEKSNMRDPKYNIGDKVARCIGRGPPILKQIKVRF